MAGAKLDVQKAANSSMFSVIKSSLRGLSVFLFPPLSPIATLDVLSSAQSVSADVYLCLC